MNKLDGMRVDKWLFVVRLFKTRSQAAEACRTGKVRLNGSSAKAAKLLHIGDTISVRQNPIFRMLKVIDLTGKRVGARLVPDFAEDNTPLTELEKLRQARRKHGDLHSKTSGRLSKRDRRLIHRFTDCDQA